MAEGEYTAFLRPDLAELFWRKVKKTETCWLWLGRVTVGGYGRIGKIQILAHRLSWEIHNGPIPKDLFILHKCDNPPCVNPEHLFIGTQIDNMRDCAINERTKSKLSRETIFKIRSDYATGKFFQRELADKYGTTLGIMHHIIRNRSFKHVENPLDNIDKVRFGKSKLRPENVKEIRERYEKGGITKKELSIIYNVDEPCIYKIINRINWKNI